MDRTVRDHISFLESRLQELNASLMDGAETLPQRNRLESEIRMAEMALNHYRRALELERQIGR
jgi:hypothetical protein